MGFLIPFDDAVAGYTRRNSDNKRNDTFHVKYLYSVPFSGVYEPSRLATGAVFILGLKNPSRLHIIYSQGSRNDRASYPFPAII